MSDWDDDEWPEEDWPDDDEGESITMPCSSCGEEIYEDAEQCPYCGDYVTAASRTVWDGRPVWWIVLGGLGVVASIMALSGL